MQQNSLIFWQVHVPLYFAVSRRTLHIYLSSWEILGRWHETPARGHRALDYDASGLAWEHDLRTASSSCWLVSLGPILGLSWQREREGGREGGRERKRERGMVKQGGRNARWRRKKVHYLTSWWIWSSEEASQRGEDQNTQVEVLQLVACPLHPNLVQDLVPPDSIRRVYIYSTCTWNVRMLCTVCSTVKYVTQKFVCFGPKKAIWNVPVRMWILFMHDSTWGCGYPYHRYKLYLCDFSFTHVHVLVYTFWRGGKYTMYFLCMYKKDKTSNEKVGSWPHQAVQTVGHRHSSLPLLRTSTGEPDLQQTVNIMNI